MQKKTTDHSFFAILCPMIVAKKQKVQMVDTWYLPKKTDKPNRLLFQSRGVWHIVITLVATDSSRAVRKCFSLHTKDIDKARKRRDNILKTIEENPTFSVTIP